MSDYLKMAFHLQCIPLPFRLEFVRVSGVPINRPLYKWYKPWIQFDVMTLYSRYLSFASGMHGQRDSGRANDSLALLKNYGNKDIFKVNGNHPRYVLRPKKLFYLYIFYFAAMKSSIKNLIKNRHFHYSIFRWKNHLFILSQLQFILFSIVMSVVSVFSFSSNFCKYHMRVSAFQQPATTTNGQKEENKYCVDVV